MSIGEYYIGLDMGTSSVGWAVTDKNYKILRAKGKDLWGIREFEEAKTSEDRRTNRVSIGSSFESLVKSTDHELDWLISLSPLWLMSPCSKISKMLTLTVKELSVT